MQHYYRKVQQWFVKSSVLIITHNNPRHRQILHIKATNLKTMLNRSIVIAYLTPKQNGHTELPGYLFVPRA